MVVIDERIWSEWRAQSAGEGAEWALTLLLSASAGSEIPGTEVVHQAVREVRAPYDERDAPPGADPPFAGEWDVAPVRDGVVIHVTECDVFEAALPALAAALERRGVAGTLSLRRAPVVAEPPSTAPLLTCRLCVRGERVSSGAGSYAWRNDPRAYWNVLCAAEAWCRRPRAALSLSVGMGGVDRVATDEPVALRMGEALRSGDRPILQAIAADQFRIVTLVPYSGRISLVVGSTHDEPGWWHAPLAELRDLLRAQAAWLAYAFVRHGWSVHKAIWAEEVRGDWPRREHQLPQGKWFSMTAFDDLVAPDAFAVQLLGPGFAGRVPAGRAWRSEIVAENTALLEHVDPSAWFDAPFAPFGDVDAAWEAPAPDVLAHARADLAPILHSRTALGDLGFPDMVGP